MRVSAADDVHGCVPPQFILRRKVRYPQYGKPRTASSAGTVWMYARQMPCSIVASDRNRSIGCRKN